MAAGINCWSTLDLCRLRPGSGLQGWFLEVPYGVEVFVHDPEADPDEAMQEYGVRLLGWDDLPRADAIVAAVSHRKFNTLGAEDLSRKLVKGGCVIDVKSAFDPAALTLAGLRVWRL